MLRVFMETQNVKILRPHTEQVKSRIKIESSISRQWTASKFIVEWHLILVNRI